MKTLRLIIITFFMFTLIKTEHHFSDNEKPLHNESPKLGFYYQNLHLEEDCIFLFAYLTNESDITIYPKSLYLKIYDDNHIYAEENFFFPKGFSLNPIEMHIVTIRIFDYKNVDNDKLREAFVYYEYNITKSPMETLDF